MKTRAALFHAPGAQLELCEIELEEPRAGDVLVRMAATGVCGSDLHLVRGEWTRPTPMVLGHEGAGVIEAVGDGVGGHAPGDRVLLSWAPSCGECLPCRTGRPVACAPLRAGVSAGTLPDGTTRMSADGRTVYRMTAIGALAERIVVPANAALPLPDDIELDHAALVGCAVLTGVGAALHRAHITPGASVLVVGAGGVGQFCVQGARIAGALRIVAADPLPGRREQALRLGATEAVDPAEVGTGEFDSALDAVGGSESFALAVKATRGGGTVVAVGMPAAGVRYELEPAQLTNEEKVLTGSLYGSEDPAVALPAVLDHVRHGRLDLAGALGPSFPLEQANEAVETALAGEPGRVLVTMAA